MVHIFVYQWEVQDICICTCTCTCLRAQNRARKTHVFGKRTFGGHDGVGWGRLVNVPCTSYVICCYAERSLVQLLRYMLLRCSWWGGVGGHFNVPCTSYVICCYAAEISGAAATLYVATLLMMGWGGGGISTFLVLRTLYVATLQRSLVRLLRYMLLRCSSYVICCYAAEISDVVATFYVATFDKISCHTGTIDAAWSAVKDFIPNSSCSKSKDLLLSVKCWQRRHVNLHTRLQQKTISTLKRLLWKEKKKCPIKSVKILHETHETRIWPNSRARIWPNLAHTNVRFAVAKTTFKKKKNVRLTSTVSGPPGCTCLCIICVCVCVCVCMCVFVGM